MNHMSSFGCLLCQLFIDYNFHPSLDLLEVHTSFPIGSGYSGLRVAYSDLMENISIALSAELGNVYLSPMMMELGQSGLSINISDGEKDGLVLQGNVEEVNSALQSFQYLGYSN